ncbi:MAG: hypothetical protein JO006_10305 [Paucibacter sp.]|nr:hypothetical protein [Roseateles sp.]
MNATVKKPPAAAPSKTAAKRAGAKAAPAAKKSGAASPSATKTKAATKTAVKPSAGVAHKGSAKTEKSKAAKTKLVRDSFTMPADEYAALAQLKQRALAAAHPVKKSELLRAGVKLLAGLGEAALMRALTSVPAIKTGRPKSKKAA